MNFYAVRAIPCAFLWRHNPIPLRIHRREWIFLILANPYRRFTPSSYTLPIFICGRELLLRTPDCFPHSVEEVEVEVV